MIGHSKSMLNRFVDVDVPTTRALFQKVGALDPTSGQYSEEVVPTTSGRKLDNLADMDRYDAMMQSEESSKNE